MQTFSDCVRGCVPSLLSIAVATASSSTSSSSSSSSSDAAAAAAARKATQVAMVTFLKTFLAAKKGWGYQLLRALVQDVKDEVALVEAVEDHVLRAECATTLYPVFRLILQLLYDEELVTEDALMKWIQAREDEDAGTPRGALFRQPQVQAFVEWLQEEEEEDDEDEDEDDE